MKQNKNVDYYEGTGITRHMKIESESLAEIYEHLEELKNNPPKSKIGKKKLKYYQDKLSEYGT